VNERVVDLGNLEAVFQTMSVEEVEFLEDKFDRPIDDLVRPGDRRGPLYRAIVWLVLRREDPDFTWEAAGKVRVDMGPAIANGQGNGKPAIPPTAAAASARRRR
jgi:hypothetical protein